MKTINQQVLSNSAVTLSIKREDLIHPVISGNKFRKLKYNLVQAKIEQHDTLLTFGGAYSNHIAAVAEAAKQHGFKSIGIIRGEELDGTFQENPTLHYASECGMKLHFISRAEYRLKSTGEFIEKLHQTHGSFYILPEGGTNDLAIKGCEEILTLEDSEFDYICCAAGTGGTAAGIANSLKDNQHLLVFPALSGNFLKTEINNYTVAHNWNFIEGYEMGGYGKITSELIRFINEFFNKTKIPLDPIYTGKLLFGVMDLIDKNYFPSGAKILAIHTGGLQGVRGMNNSLKSKNLPIIEFDV